MTASAKDGIFKWYVFSKNFCSNQELAAWLQELGDEYEFYSLKLYETQFARLVCRKWFSNI